jgi:DNA polymerase-3 subunit delta'
VFFNEIIGQSALKKRLIQSVKDSRISHAQLFFGPEGSGALPMSIAYAQYISCSGLKDDDACGKCPSCLKYSKLIHPDLHFVFPVNATTAKENPFCDDFLADWRSFVLQQPYARLNDWYSFIELENKQGLIKEKESDALLKKISFKPFESDFKVAIIWMAEKMNDSASNKLLKLLEEPPDMTVFMLIAENTEQLLTTVRSRCFPVKVPVIDEEDMKSALQKTHGLDTEKSETVARLAMGNYLKAMEFINENDENNALFLLYQEYMRACYGNNIESILQIVDQLNGFTREKQKSFLDISLRMTRENVMKHFNNSSLIFMNKAEEDFSIKFSKFVNGRNVIQLSDEFNKAYRDIERNGNSKITLLDLSLKVGRLLRL